jgi:putative ABC transport system permease protein
MTIFELPRVDEIRMSGVVLAFTVGLSIATGVVFGTVPALQILRPGVIDRLRQSGPGDPGALWRCKTFGLRTRGMLVVGQVALSMVLLIGAALMMKSLTRLASVNPGFRPDGLLTMRIPLPPAPYDTPEKRARFLEETVSRVEALPGVRGAAVARSLPMTTGGLATNIQVVGFEIAEPGHLAVGVQSITPGYFKVLGINLKRGREFVARDNAPGAPPVAIINETLARRVWPGYPSALDPLGQRLLVPILRPQIAGNGPLEIVGVAADVRELGPMRAPNPQFYLPNILYPPQTAYLAVRTSGDASTAAAAIRAEVQAIDPGQSVADIRLMDEVSEAFVGQRHLAARLLNLFAGAAVLLVVVGIYGVLAYSVALRTTEIGIRRALGANRDDILVLVLGQVARFTLIGVVCGLAGAFVVTRLLETLLFEVSATDPSTFVGVAVVFVVVALIAGLIPAWRAVRIDPMSVLRV